ncbi:hypothetical protein GUJ93_ZPchr0008g12524 [Zizania palustris]|uniref:Uncharacterized protein n=1 Tax=Zizania palustris TaxID=103762 RepID=A0A8J5RKL4_ZIZPA|nr:hypothetical protein GUJ93_ZPchr0008g12524 [Zizania palustris]
MNRQPQIGRDMSLSWLMSGPSAPLLIPVDKIEAWRSSLCHVHVYDRCPPRTPPLPSLTPTWAEADLPLSCAPFGTHQWQPANASTPHRASALVRDMEHQG